jgi:hypothetical protein
MRTLKRSDHPEEWRHVPVLGTSREPGDPERENERTRRAGQGAPRCPGTDGERLQREDEKLTISVAKGLSVGR